MANPTLKVTKDFTKDFNDVIKRFRNDTVRVGIPAEDNSRADGPIGNAGLLAIATFGSPARNIPPWDILGIGIRKVQNQIAEQFKQGAKLALSQGVAGLEQMYNRVGIIASFSCKNVLNTQQGVPANRPTKSTLAARKRFGFLGKKYWLVSGQLRNALTYVVGRI